MKILDFGCHFKKLKCVSIPVQGVCWVVGGGGLCLASSEWPSPKFMPFVAYVRGVNHPPKNKLGITTEYTYTVCGITLAYKLYFYYLLKVNLI